MKRLIFSALVMFSVAVSAQEPLFTPQQMPNSVYFLPPPPDTASMAFKYDISQYYWGKEQRKDSARVAMALRDAVWSLSTICTEFSLPFGMEISEKGTPAIYNFLKASIDAADQARILPKAHYMRVRPYVYFNEATIYPDDEEELRTNGSYPSGHTIRGWTAALVLSEVNPDSANALLARGYEFGQSRVIAGYHWQSDVDAARLVAAAAVARMHADERFLELLEKAKNEMRKVGR
ncbi:MAG: phosphatase PAP2 family protein [Bacteroidales bacterium]|nr:phosphatase PAP2 family protein [Bacteroidales bacterium]